MMYAKVISLDEDTIRELAPFLNRYFNLEMGVFKASALQGQPLYAKALEEGLLVVINEYAQLTDKGRGLVNIRAVPRSYREAEKARAEKAEREHRMRESTLPAHPLYHFLATHCNPVIGSCDIRQVAGTADYERCLHEGLVKELNGMVMLTDKGTDVVLDRDGLMKIFHDAFGAPVSESAVRKHNYYRTALLKKLVIEEKADAGVFVRLTEAGQHLMDELFYFDRRKKG